MFQRHLITRFNVGEVNHVLRVENRTDTLLKWENDILSLPIEIVDEGVLFRLGCWKRDEMQKATLNYTTDIFD